MNSNLSTYGKMAIAAITFHSYDDGPAWPGSERLARLCSCSKRRVLLAVKELETAGFLKIDRERGKVNTYEFLSKTGYPQSPVKDSLDTHSHHTSDPESPLPPKLVTHGHSNETLKPNETKERNITPQGEFVEWFKDQYLKKFGKPYLDGKADYIKTTEVLRIFKPETLRILVFQGWDHKDEYIKTASMTVKGFCSIINRLSLPGAVKPKAIPGAPQDIGWLERMRRERAAGNG